MYIFSHTAFSVLLLIFSPHSVDLSKDTINWYSLETPERILTVKAVKNQPLQCKEAGETAQNWTVLKTTSLNHSTRTQNDGNEMFISA